MAAEVTAQFRLPDGRAIFTPFVLPGETARVRLTEEKRGYVRGALVEILQRQHAVLRTLLRFQRPLRMEIRADGAALTLKTPLVFIARSAYQLANFGLAGGQAISDDNEHGA